MSRLTPAQKQQARVNQRWAVRISAAGTLATAGVAAIPPVGPLIAIAPAAVTVLFMLRADSQGGLILDPPREDFTVPSGVADSALHLDALLQSPLGEPAIPLVGVLDEATRLLDATLVAVERAEGADLAGESATGLQRESEAYEWAGAAAGRFLEVSTAAIAFADALGEYRGTRITRRRQLTALAALGSGTVLRVLPKQTIEGLREIGLERWPRGLPLPRPRELTSDRPVEQFITALHDVSRADRIYGESLSAAVAQRTLFEQGVLPA